MFALVDELDTDGEAALHPLAEAGFRSSRLIANPEDWINRRVETVEMLSQEETRRRVSVDFTLPGDPDLLPSTPEGIAVPISVLAKQRRRNFSLRDESGNAVPVLGQFENSVMAHAAILGVALNLMDSDDAPDEVFESIAESLWGVVTSPSDIALEIAGAMLHDAEAKDSWLSKLFEDFAFRRLLALLVDGYVLFAVIPEGGPRRRILKFSYGQDFEFEPIKPSPWRSRKGLRERWQAPDGHRFLIELEMSSWATSFHLEVAIPEELRAGVATLYSEEAPGIPLPMGEPEVDVNRISLHVPTSPESLEIAGAFVELLPERSGQISQGLAVGAVVTAVLLAGSLIGTTEAASDAAVSILLVGAAIFSSVNAPFGKHFLVNRIFAGTRLVTLAVGVAAVAGALSLVLDMSPGVKNLVWFLAGLAALIATLRLALASIRAAK